MFRYADASHFEIKRGGNRTTLDPHINLSIGESSNFLQFFS